jgi:asparagine synthase (glutamine-hydrolysing)
VSSRQREIRRDREKGTVAAIHGEIHNYGEIKRSLTPGTQDCGGDVDAVLHLYRRDGRAFAERLNGLFTIAVLDEKKSTFLLLNDRFGMAHQVYWTIMGGRFCFASHLKTMLLLPGVRKEMDPEAMNLFLKYAYIPSPRSIFQGIRKLPPGHMLVFQRGRRTRSPHGTSHPPAATEWTPKRRRAGTGIS